MHRGFERLWVCSLQGKIALVMTTYTIIATWGAMKLSEEMDIRSDLTPENESQYAKNLILDKWIRIFGDQFINAADEITTEAVVPTRGSSGPDAHAQKLEASLADHFRGAEGVRV